MSHIDEQHPHRLFAAIVLMGTSLATGCGGLAEGERQTGVGGQPDSSVSGSSAAAGTAASVGGATSTSTAGTSNTGGPVINIGGSTPAPATAEPGPFACPPEQWSCPSTECRSVDSGWVLPDACACDPKRPLKASDCQPGQVFVCQNATRRADGKMFTKPVALACSCVEKSGNFCSTECDVAYGQRDLQCFGAPDELSALCGCAVVYLK